MTLVTHNSSLITAPSVIVTVNDRGPAWRLVRQGRTIDLSSVAFAKLADPKLGLIRVKITKL